MPKKLVLLGALLFVLPQLWAQNGDLGTATNGGAFTDGRLASDQEANVTELLKYRTSFKPLFGDSPADLEANYTWVWDKLVKISPLDFLSQLKVLHDKQSGVHVSELAKQIKSPNQVSKSDKHALAVAKALLRYYKQ